MSTVVGLNLPRICFVHAIRGGGGSARSLNELLRALPSDGGHSVVCVSQSPGAEIVADGQPHLVVPVSPRMAASPARHLVGLRRALSVSDPDIVVANTMGSLPAVLVGAPLRCSVGVMLRNSDYSSRERILLRVVPYARRRVIALAPSQYSLDLAASIAAWCAHGHVVPNIVKAGGPPPFEREKREHFTVGVVTSSSSSVKGIDFLAEVLRAAQGTAIRWRVYGVSEDVVSVAPPLRDFYVHMSADPTVSIAGRRSFAKEVAQLDAVLITSRRESFCRVAAEAMVAGVPVVAPAATALPELLDQGRSGLLFPPGDSRSAVQALLAVRASEQVRQRVADAARIKALSDFSADSVVRRLARALAQPSAGGSPRAFAWQAPTGTMRKRGRGLLRRRR